MSKIALLPAVIALAGSSAAFADTPVGPFHMSPTAHRCQDSTGKFVMTKFCSASVAHSYKMDKKGKCRDEKGRFTAMKLCPMKGMEVWATRQPGLRINVLST